MRRKCFPWAAFERAARPIIAEYVDRDSRTPYSTRLVKDGHSWIISGMTRNGYGPYQQMLKRMGFTQPCGPIVTHPGFRPMGYWHSDANIRRELRTMFPRLLAWDIMPSSHMLEKKLSGLKWRVEGRGAIGRLCQRLGLLPYDHGCRNRRRIKGIYWALSFYEHHGRWPYARECPHYVRDVRYQANTTWHDYCRPTGLTRSVLPRLQRRLRRHMARLKRQRPEKVQVRRRVLNWLIIEETRRFPTVLS